MVIESLVKSSALPLFFLPIPLMQPRPGAEEVVVAEGVVSLEVGEEAHPTEDEAVPTDIAVAIRTSRDISTHGIPKMAAMHAYKQTHLVLRALVPFGFWSTLVLLLAFFLISHSVIYLTLYLFV